MTTVLPTLVVEAYSTEPFFATDIAFSSCTGWGSAAPPIDRKLA